MSNHLWIRLLAGAALLSLAACGDSDGGDAIGKPKPKDPTPQSQFGATFEAAFNAKCNADPIDPQTGDLPPVSCESDPIDF